MEKKDVRSEYYIEKLSSNKLKKCYEIAGPRIQQMLKSEIDFVLQLISEESDVLELGCGYGRVLKEISKKCKGVVTGVDHSPSSIDFAKKYCKGFVKEEELLVMDVRSLKLSRKYDFVVAIQNSVSAFKMEISQIVENSLGLLKKDGKIVLSSYSPKIWEKRLEWFMEQGKCGLLGDIVVEKCKDGVIVGKDGFVSSMVSEEEFFEVKNKFQLDGYVVEVDESSVFCVLKKKDVI